MKYFVGMHPLDNVALGNGRALVLLQQYMLREYREKEGKRRDFTGLEMKKYTSRKPIDRISGLCYAFYDRDCNLLGPTGIYTSVRDKAQRLWYDFYETSELDNTYEKTAGFLSVDDARFVDGTGIYEVLSHKTSIILKTTTWVPFGIDAVIRKIEVSSQFPGRREMTVFPQLHLRGTLKTKGDAIISEVENCGQNCYLAVGCTDAEGWHYGDFLQGTREGFSQRLPRGEEPSDRANLTFRVEREVLDGKSKPVYLVLGLGRSDEEALDNYHRVYNDPDGALQSSLEEWNSWLGKGVQLSSSNKELDYQWRKSKSLLRRTTQEDGLYTYIGFLAYQKGVWLRDTCFIVIYLARIGYLEESLRVMRGLAGILKKREDGNFYFRYNCRTHQQNEFTIENDSMGSLLSALGILHEASGDLEIAREFWELIRYCARWIGDHRDETGLILPSAGIWEDLRPERGGNYEHVVWDAGVSAFGLEKASLVAEALGHQDKAAIYRKVSRDLKSAILAGAVKKGVLCRSSESEQTDTAVLPFFTWLPVLGEETELLRATLAKMEETIQDKQLGGFWRGAGLFGDLADGMPWPCPTFWVIQAHLKLGDPDKAWEVLRWVLDHTSRCGSMPEQLQGDAQPLGITAASVSEGQFLLTMTYIFDGKKGKALVPRELKYLKFKNLPSDTARD